MMILLIKTCYNINCFYCTRFWSKRSGYGHFKVIHQDPKMGNDEDDFLSLSNQLLDVNTSASSKFREFLWWGMWTYRNGYTRYGIIYFFDLVLNQFATFQHTIVCDQTSVLFLNTIRIHGAWPWWNDFYGWVLALPCESRENYFAFWPSKLTVNSSNKKKCKNTFTYLNGVTMT